VGTLAVKDELKTKQITTKKIKLEDINAAAGAMVNRQTIGRWQIMFN
jgi:hypothetical protein